MTFGGILLTQEPFHESKILVKNLYNLQEKQEKEKKNAD